MTRPRSTTTWRHFSNLPPMSPGPDGIPNACWAGGGFTSAVVAQRFYSALAEMQQMHYYFNASVVAFIMKKIQDGDENEIIREPKALRTVNLKKCDAKSVAFVANTAVAGPLAQRFPPAQRGFIRGRQFVYNAIEVDAGARDADMCQELGALLPLDIENTFLALSQQFLFEVIQQAGLQAGLVNVIHGLLEPPQMLPLTPAPSSFYFGFFRALCKGAPFLAPCFGV